MNWRGSLLLDIILIFGALLPAQVQDLGAPIITNYETEQFGANSQNWIAIQDKRGVMYFGNSSGILEFDGQRWQLIPLMGTRALTCGPDGTIYYGAIADFGYLAVSPSGKVSAVSLKGAIPREDRLFNDIWQVESNADGIYFLTQSRIFRLYSGRITALPGKFAASQACVLNGTLFYADREKGVCLVNQDKVVPIPPLAGVYNGKRITLAPFGRHELLVGRMTGDFLRVDLAALWDETAQRYDITRPAPKDMIQAFPSELDALLNMSAAILYKLVPLGPDAFAISTIKAGIITFDRAGKIIRAINKAGGLLDNTVWGIFMDRSHNLWAASNSGVSHIELSVPQSYFGERNNINGVSISTIVHNGRLYVGTFQDMLVLAPYRFSLQDDKQVFKTLKNSPSQVWQFLDVDGDLMAASGSGLFQVQGEEAIKIQGITPISMALSLATSRRWPGYLFVGLLGGLDVFRHKTGPGLKGMAHWEFLGKMNDVKDNIRAIAEDINGDLWAGTDAKGLLQIHFSGANPTQAAIHRFGPDQGLPGLSGLRAVSRGTTLFVISPKGLFRTTISSDAAQAPEQIRFILDTILGKSFLNSPVTLNIMIFAQKGSAVFSTSEGVFWAIPEKDGQYRMEARPFRSITAPEDLMYLHPDGSLWLPGKKLYQVDLNALKDYDQPFNVLVRKVVAKFNRIVFEGTHGRPGSAFGERRTLFVLGQDPLETPELPFRENALSFEFAATFYEKPGTTQFKFILEGFDKDWSDWGTDTFKEYSYLPEGNYRFRVKAKNLYGTPGREASYRLRILPPWYRTIWAYALWVFGSLATLVWIIRLYTMNLRRQKDHLENIVAKRTQQLRETSEQLRETSEQLRVTSLTDPLTGLRNRRFIQEVMQTDIATFIGFKNHQLNAKEQRKTAHEDTMFGILLMDIDFFKKVNDTYGHDAGDQVLKQFATILTDSVRPDDTVIRVGGDEFLVVLKKTIPDYLHVFATKVLEKVAATPFAIGGGTTIQKTCSIGYASFPVYKKQPGLLSFEQSTMIADLGLFHAKNHGRNQGVSMQAGPRIPCGEDVIQKTVTSLEFAMQGGYLQIDNVIAGKKP